MSNKENNLPMKQGLFSKFFSKIRAKLNRKNKNDNVEYNKNNKQSKKKSWEIKAEDKIKIQNQTAIDSKKYVEQ